MTHPAAGSLHAIGEVLTRHGYRLARAVPRGEGHLLVWLSPATGDASLETVAGQWFADRDRAAKVTRTTAAIAADAGVELVADRVVVQPAGADRRLPALSRLAAKPGASLVVHRPERRGVIRHVVDDAVVFTKVVRPDRLPRLVDTLETVAARSDVPVPGIVATDARAGTISTSALPGRTLHDLLDDPTVTPDGAHAAGVQVGSAIRRLHTASPPTGAVAHDAAAEIAVLERWIGLARRFETLPEELVGSGPMADELARARRLLADLPSPERAALLHRDLHDKQLVLDGRSGTAMLDLDLLAVGDPALDLANLLVHLELQAIQGDGVVAAACARGVLAGYDPASGIVARLPAWALASRLRLVAVHSFRPVTSAAATALLAIGNGPLDLCPGLLLPA